jgi:acetyltransferase-like isoleucine patch superfamily enzyme
MTFKKLILSNSYLTGLTLFFWKLYLKHKYAISYGRNTFIGLSTRLEGKNSFGNGSIIASSKIGYASYLGNNTSFTNTSIGRYCSIGSNIGCISGKHPSSIFVSTHPAFFSTKHPINMSYVKQQMFEEHAPPRDLEGKYSIIIGNDVWIGENSKLMDGIVIGDGAIIAANALVVKDVQPYSIVGGVPASIIKYRFSNEDIAFLMKLKWWDKPENWIKEHAEKFKNIKILKKSIANV